MANNSDNGIYKLIVIIGVILVLLWGFASMQQDISDSSGFLGFIVGPIFIYFIYKIIKFVWPDFW
jgi:hypothetical protein